MLANMTAIETKYMIVKKTLLIERKAFENMQAHITEQSMKMGCLYQDLKETRENQKEREY